MAAVVLQPIFIYLLFWHELEKKSLFFFSLKPLKSYVFKMAQSQINNKLQRNASWCLLSVLKITIVFILIGSFGLWKENIFEKYDWNVKISFISLEFNYICPFSSDFWHGAYGSPTYLFRSPWNILNLNFFAIIPNLYFRKTKTSKNWFRTNVL